VAGESRTFCVYLKVEHVQLLDTCIVESCRFSISDIGDNVFDTGYMSPIHVQLLDTGDTSTLGRHKILHVELYMQNVLTLPYLRGGQVVTPAQR